MSVMIKGYEIREKFIDPARLLVFKEAINNCPLQSYSNDNFLKVIDPFYKVPEIIHLATSAKITEIMNYNLGKSWGIGTGNLRRSLLTERHAGGTTLFHRDDNSKNFLKMFFYLNDVDIAGGPFTYVEGSHLIRKETGWSPGSRWSDEQIIELYGAESIKHLTANIGDALIANTTGFHKGLKCQSREREMLTINFTTEEEKFGRFKFPRSVYKKLTNEQQYRCRFMDIIE